MPGASGRPVNGKCQHEVADGTLLQRVRLIHASSRQTYGIPCMHAELRVGG